MEIDRHPAPAEDGRRGPGVQGPGQAPPPPRLHGGPRHHHAHLVVALDAATGSARLFSKSLTATSATSTAQIEVTTTVPIVTIALLSR